MQPSVPISPPTPHRHRRRATTLAIDLQVLSALTSRHGPPPFPADHAGWCSCCAIRRRGPARGEGVSHRHAGDEVHPSQHRQHRRVPTRDAGTWVHRGSELRDRLPILGRPGRPVPGPREGTGSFAGGLDHDEGDASGPGGKEGDANHSGRHGGECRSRPIRPRRQPRTPGRECHGSEQRGHWSVCKTDPAAQRAASETRTNRGDL